MTIPEGWTRLWQAVGAKGEGGPVLRLLERLYGEPQRHYHTLKHIEHCVWEFELARELAEHPDELEFAIWFHDAVHDTRETDNEERSAALAKQVLLEAGVDAESTQRIEALILATAHESPPVGVDQELLVDVDLTILGQDAATFDHYEEGVRREYAWVADTAFRAGRAQVLRGFIDRDAIYRTPIFRERYEAPARANIERSLEFLVTASSETALPWFKAPPDPAE